MRRMLSFFLVMLLVLRGLAGDAMAMGTLPTMPMVAVAHASLVDGAGHRTVADGAAHAGHHAAPAWAAEPLSLDHHGQAGDHRAGAQSGSCAAAGADVDALSPHCGDHRHGAPCAACVICHSALSLVMQLPAMAEGSTHAQPLGPTARFASALPLQASKPPIS